MNKIKSENNKNWIGNQKAVHSTLGSSNHSKKEREKMDFYATNPSAINDLFKREEFSNDIWECACGKGHLSKRMEKLGKNVYSTDIINRGFGDDFFDFLICNKKWNGDIITNPPYKLAKEFVIRSLELIPEGNKVAMFLKLLFLESQSRVELFKEYPPKKVWVYSKRKTVAKNGDPKEFQKSSAVCYAWFIWKKGFKGDPIIKWIFNDNNRRMF